MRQTVSHVLERHRVIAGGYATKRGDRDGLFVVPHGAPRAWLRVLVGSGDSWHADGLSGPIWEHASVVVERDEATGKPRLPTWPEMHFVKQLLWDDEEAVMQLHPPQSRYVNKCEWALHLWKPVGVEIPLPPKECV